MTIGAPDGAPSCCAAAMVSHVARLSLPSLCSAITRIISTHVFPRSHEEHEEHEAHEDQRQTTEAQRHREGFGGSTLDARVELSRTPRLHLFVSFASP